MNFPMRIMHSMFGGHYIYFGRHFNGPFFRIVVEGWFCVEAKP